MKTTTIDTAVQEMPREAPAAKLPVVIPMGMLQPIDSLPPYQRCDRREELELIIEDLIAGEMVPRSFIGKDGNPNKAKMRIAIMNGRELGYSPLFSIQHQYVVNGIPSWFGDVPLGRCYVSGLVEDFEERFEPGETDDKGVPKNPKAICRTKRRGVKTETVREFSWSDAKTAELVSKDGPWQGYWKRMMQMRARGFAIRDAYADVLMGMRIAEEHFTTQHWNGDGGGQIIDVDATVAPPPRPQRPVEGAAQPETQAPAPVLYPVIDAIGNPCGELPSGDWIDEAQNYLERLEPHHVETWFEHNIDTLTDLGQTLGADKIKWFLDFKEKAAAPETEKAASAGALDKPMVAAPAAEVPAAIDATAVSTPAPSTEPKAAPLPDTTSHTGKPAATGAVFKIKNWKGEIKHEGTAPTDFIRAIDWLLGIHGKLSPEDRKALTKHNIEWLLDANKAGVLTPIATAMLLPPDPPAPAPSAPPISQTPPPPPPKPPAAAQPAPAAQTAPPAPPAEAAEEPAKKRGRKPKEKDQEQPAATDGVSLESQFKLSVMPYSFEVSNHTAYYTTMIKEMNRLKEAGAPPAAFIRFREINAANIADYRTKSKTWCAQMERLLEKSANPS